MKEIPPDKVSRALCDLNSHWASGAIGFPYAGYRHRAYFERFFALVSQTTVQRAVILMGPRRVGKTVMLQQAIQALIDKGIDPHRIAYIPADTPVFQGLAIDELLTFFQRMHGLDSLSGCYVLLDEIQYVPDWSTQLKVLVDHRPDLRLVASGSAAAALTRSSRESGAGRFTDFALPPLVWRPVGTGL